jgi:hypothetical protein
MAVDVDHIGVDAHKQHGGARGALAVPGFNADRQKQNRDARVKGVLIKPLRIDRILANPLSSNPLFLKTVLEELRYSATELRLDEVGDHATRMLRGETVGRAVVLP